MALFISLFLFFFTFYFLDKDQDGPSIKRHVGQSSRQSMGECHLKAFLLTFSLADLISFFFSPCSFPLHLSWSLVVVSVPSVSLGLAAVEILRLRDVIALLYVLKFSFSCLTCVGCHVWNEGKASGPVGPIWEHFSWGLQVQPRSVEANMNQVCNRLHISYVNWKVISLC